MRSTPFLFEKVLLLALLHASSHSHGQGTFAFRFEGQPAGTGMIVEQYYEREMWFRSISGAGFTISGSNPPAPFWPDNGSGFLMAGAAHSLVFNFVDERAFNFLSVDLSEFSTAYQQPLSVRFVGYWPDGSSVTADILTDGIIDGAGPLTDYQTFFFGAEFTGVVRVEIPTSGWCLDNLVVSIPEPSSGALLAAGIGLFVLLIVRRRHQLH